MSKDHDKLSPVEQKVADAVEIFSYDLVRLIASYADDEKGIMEKLKADPRLNSSMLRAICMRSLLEGCYQMTFDWAYTTYKDPLPFNTLTTVLTSTSERASPEMKCQLVKHLLAKGPKGDATSMLARDVRNTPLMCAAEQGNAPAVKELLLCDAYFGSESERTPLALALKGNHLECAMLILHQCIVHKMRDLPHHSEEAQAILKTYSDLVKDPAFKFLFDSFKAVASLKRKELNQMYAKISPLPEVDQHGFERKEQKEGQPLAEFAIGQLLQAAEICRKRFPTSDSSGVQAISSLVAEITQKRSELNDPIKLFDYLEDKLNNDPKLHLYLTDPRSSGAMASAIFLIQTMALANAEDKVRQYGYGVEPPQKAPSVRPL